MDCATLHYSRHAFERMFLRGVTPQAVTWVAQNGQSIATYSDEKPYPSDLILGFWEARPIHVVAARDRATGNCFVITVYLPDPALWDDTYTHRRTS